MGRGENPDDLYYLCDIDNKHYIIFETDYVSSLSGTLKEAEEIFSTYNLFPLYWLVKKSHQKEMKESRISIETLTDIESLRKIFTLKPDGSYLKYTVMEFGSNVPQPKRYDPNSYGSIS